MASELGMRPLVAHCHLGLGSHYAKIGRREQARAELSAAIELFRAMEMPFWLTQAEAALAQAECITEGKTVAIGDGANDSPPTDLSS